jgi:hypothetical protein
MPAEYLNIASEAEKYKTKLQRDYLKAEVFFQSMNINGIQEEAKYTVRQYSNFCPVDDTAVHFREIPSCPLWEEPSVSICAWQPFCCLNSSSWWFTSAWKCGTLLEAPKISRNVNFDGWVTL